MRKSLLILGLAALLVLLVAVPAYASGAIGYQDPTPMVSPHGGYSDGTNFCKSCHAVHGAGDGLSDDGAPEANPPVADPRFGEIRTDPDGTGGPLPNAWYPINVVRGDKYDTEVLLRTTKNGACVYCHFNTTFTASQPYGSDVAAYYEDTNNNHAGDHHQAGTYDGCTSCHTVHGATAKVLPGFAGSIVKNQPNALRPAITGVTGAAALTDFCAACHDNRPDNTASVANASAATTYTADADGCMGTCHNRQISYNSVTGTTTLMGARGDVQYVWENAAHNGTSHIMTSTLNGNAVSGQFASAGSQDCTSCHTGGATTFTPMNSFPHYTTSRQFLPNTLGQGTGAVKLDSVCRTCHANVGVTF